MRYVFGDYELDEQLYELRRAGEPVELERKVYDVLAYLIQHRERLVTKDELLDQLWPGQVVGEAALTRCITSIRKTLGDDGNRQEIIKTQYGRGYRFVAALAAPVSGSTLQVLGQDEGGNSQRVVVSQQEQNGNSHELEASWSPSASVGAPASSSPGSTVSRFRRGQVLLLSVLVLLGIVITAEWRFVRSLNAPTISTSDPTVLPLPDKPSIIVLPFANMSEDPGQDYFSDGLTEDLTSDLSKLSSLFVISRHTAFTYKGKTVKLSDVSRELGVRYVVEGSVRRAGDQVRITAQLLDATQDQHLWSERYDRSLQDLFALQDEIREKIVTALKVKLTPEEQERFRRAPTDNLEAYEYWLRGHELSLRSLQEAKKDLNEQARQMYKKAVERDLHYAGAHAWLAWTHFQDAFYLWSEDRSQSLERASELAQQAVMLDDSLSTSHWILGMVLLWQRHHDQALSAGERAVALDSNDADSRVSLGNTLVFAGQPEEGIELIKTAMRLNPHYPPRYLNLLGLAYRMAGRCEEALAPLEEAVILSPNFAPAHYNLAACYADLDRLAEAQKEMAEILRLNPTASLEKQREFMPFKDPADMERNLAVLRKAGLK